MVGDEAGRSLVGLRCVRFVHCCLLKAVAAAVDAVVDVADYEKSLDHDDAAEFGDVTDASD